MLHQELVLPNERFIFISAEENSKASSVVRGLELLSEAKRNTGFLGNAIHTIKKSAEVAKRHLEMAKRSDGEEMVLRTVTNKIKKAAEEGKRKRDLEVESELYKRACGIGLFCAPGLFEHAQRKRDEDTKAILRAAAEKIKRAEDARKRKEDNKALRDVADTIKQAVENAEKHRREEQKRNTGGFLSNALNVLQRSADMANRHVERNAEDTTAFQTVAANLRKREENSKVFRDVANNIKQLPEKTKHRREEEKRNVGGFLNNALNALQRSADMVKRHIERNTKRDEAQERVFREVAGRMKKQAEKNEERKRTLRGVMDKVKEAADAYKQKREEKTQKYEEQRRVFRDVAESLKKSALNANRREQEEIKRTEETRNRREQNEVSGKSRRWCTAEGYCSEDMNRRSPGFIERIKNAFNLVATRHAESEKRDAASAIKKAVNVATEKMKREEQARLHVKHPVAASKSAIGHSSKRSSTSDEDWKRMVQEVLNKAPQIRATQKKFPLRALPGQVYTLVMLFQMQKVSPWKIRQWRVHWH